ncbi:MAG: 2-oxoglutarate dehydrogenase E1 component [Hydrogenophilales bacterium]|nr:2-oxoglutarate dehydrogenase E1 component [Hydrogenophilales bacterium]
MARDGAYYSGSAEYLEALIEGAESQDSTGLPAFAAPVEPYRVPIGCEAGQVSVLRLINAYRFHGFRVAQLNPLNHLPLPRVPDLDPSTHGLTAADLEKVFETGSLAGPKRDTLRNILARVQWAYCGTLAAEYMYITNTQRKRWLQDRLERTETRPPYPPDRQRWLLRQLVSAETLEKVIHTRFVGQKRFSVEGAEALIPLLNYIAERAAGHGVQELGLGMAHRGRINVLHNVLGKSAIEMFNHKAPTTQEAGMAGDVKYHQGFALDVPTGAGPIRIALAFNPSHLEIVGPVVRGWVRAQQQKRGDHDGGKVLAVVIHGDAAFAGQGVVMESLNMAATRGFGVGGTVHIVVNNQIGFTTSDPRDSRSSLYCTDVAKMVEAPVLHVNGDDPEAVLRAVDIAVDFRATFHKDVVIDLICYRRLGHNEQDEPMVTQPLMYQAIRRHASAMNLYAKQLERQGVILAGELETMTEDYTRGLDAMPSLADRPYTHFVADWRPYRGHDWRVPASTAVPIERLHALGAKLVDVPENFLLHPRVVMVIGNRKQMAAGNMPLDWGMAESLAYASLVTEGHGVRLTGQDSGRGTFFHRHAVLHDQNRQRWDAGAHIPLQHLDPDQAHFLVIDSLLSEEAVLAFEYGYASSSPEELVIWEGQFGDFANGAQVVIDQFIASGETKWGRMNGLTMFLPHGYEGQGPEHSSGRIERYLQLAAEDNMQIVQPSTPAQFFHLLRRQIVRPYRKPLVVFTPKSLLRHPDSTSALTDLAEGGFQAVIPDGNAVGARRLVLCSGRVYFDLLFERKEAGLTDSVALIRVEQFYPFPDAELAAVIAGFAHLEEIVWAQDEPRNQGAWRFMVYELMKLGKLKNFSNLPITYAGRPESASPATGFAAVHTAQSDSLIRAALGID